jgi:hypothetical protein
MNNTYFVLKYGRFPDCLSNSFLDEYIKFISYNFLWDLYYHDFPVVESADHDTECMFETEDDLDEEVIWLKNKHALSIKELRYHFNHWIKITEEIYE